VQKWPLANVSEFGEYSVNGLANVGKSGEYSVNGLANVGKSGEYSVNGLANVGESGESSVNGLANVGESGKSCIFPKMANFRRVLEFAKFACEWPFLKNNLILMQYNTLSKRAIYRLLF
jgi:hypothetical protein